ncbi:class B sortase [uncultured Helcococcus sp.]|uniref:class B sortase n=1 Tax=uncultured Helcococcus sp. TaxID=1072508 RepID=UPI00263425C5|nr:class B sortase [uncultured Helcococcus sp.]
MKKKTRNRILTFIQIVLLIFIAYNVYQIGSYYYSRYKAQQNYDQTSKIFEQVVNKDKDNKLDSEELKALRDRNSKQLIEDLKKKNADIEAYIRINDTRIDYPIVYKDNDYYLRRDINGKYSIPGTVFIEETNKKDFSDRNTTVYGHNMSIASPNLAPMFTDLEKYGKEDFVKSGKARTIEIYTPNGVLEYEVVSAYYIDAYYDYRSFDMSDEAWVQYANKLVNKSKLDFGFDREVGPEDKMLTLSTCDNVDDIGRFVVHAILKK